MVQKSDGFRPLLPMCSLLLLVTIGCSDDMSGRERSENDWIDARADLGGTDADTSPDADDAAVEDSGPDGSDSGADTDAGDPVTAKGWYRPSFESALFIPEPDLFESNWADGCTLQARQEFEDTEVEHWWANGIPETNLLAFFPPNATTDSQKIGLVEATGILSTPGQHGHLGGYDRTFDVTSSSVDVCGTFEALGHCVVPRGWCTKEDQEPFELVDTYLVRELPGAQPEEPTLFYNLKLSSDKSGEWTELRLDLAVPGDDQTADGGELPLYTVDELYEVSLTRHTEAAAITDTAFHDLTGWVALDTTALRESIYVSIAGVDADGNEAHIWGYFAVDETIAYP